MKNRCFHATHISNNLFTSKLHLPSIFILKYSHFIFQVKCEYQIRKEFSKLSDLFDRVFVV